MSEPRWNTTAILLVDLDAFFASVEQLDHPGWRGKPVIVGGDFDRRGVVSTASYEARSFGVRSAMPSAIAHSLCPHAIWTHGNFSRYREMSSAVMAMLRDETPKVQQVSIDEAFLDVTPTQINTENPVDIARRIQQRVKQLGITCSIGVGTSKTIAKIASDRDKPCGLTVVYPGEEHTFLAPLPVRSLSGVGPAAERKLAVFGIHTLGALAVADPDMLKRSFGKNGLVMHLRANGLDDTPVASDDVVKSVSNEVTFAQDLVTKHEIESALATIAAKVGRRLRRKNLRASTVTVKMRFSSRAIRSAQRTMSAPTDDENALAPYIVSLMDELWTPGRKVRLLGVATSGFVATEVFEQPSLFDDDDPCDVLVANSRARVRRLKGLVKATDAVRDRFGEDAISFGRDLRLDANTTGSSSKSPADYR